MRCKRILMILVAAVIILALAMSVSAQERTNIESPTELSTIAIVEEALETEAIVTEPVETQPLETEPLETEYVEKFPEVPLYFQNDYPNTPYGGYGTVRSSGCGITSLAMVLSYLLDEEIMPDTLAAKYGRYNTDVGSSYCLFPDSAEDYGVTIEKQTWQ